MNKNETDTENEKIVCSDDDNWYEAPNSIYYMFFVETIIFIAIMGLIINGIYCLSHH